MACWLVLFCCLVFVSLFCCIALLKGMMARWFLNVRFQVVFFLIAVISGAGAVVFGAQNLVHFGILGIILAVHGPLQSHGSIRKGTLGSRAGYLLISGGFRDLIFKAFLALGSRLVSFFHACFQVVSLWIFWLESD